ncbi:MAG TPA: AAA family ATPase [Thermodesulfobacteriaceae bacterium]|nr:AAA family ATPase [Thermodesulfobacteriaceae bacterium]
MANYRDYIKLLGLKEAPFRLSPDPSYFFSSNTHLSALEVLKFAIERGEGFMVLMGRAGTGKTLLIRMLLKELGPEKIAVAVVTPSVSPSGLLTLLLEELGCSSDESEQEQAVLLKRFQKKLLELAEDGRDVVIILDEAQNVPRETLEQLRMLSNLETNRRKLLQILLAGQMELKDLLDSPGLGQLTQRIVVMEKLRPFSREETREYVNFRLARAGRPDLKLTSRALDAIFRSTSGIPRLINRIMDRTLLMTAAAGRQCFGARDVEAAIDTLPAPFSGSTGRTGSRRLFSRRNSRLGMKMPSVLAVGIGLVSLSFSFAVWQGDMIKNSAVEKIFASGRSCTSRSAEPMAMQMNAGAASDSTKEKTGMNTHDVQGAADHAAGVNGTQKDVTTVMYCQMERNGFEQQSEPLDTQACSVQKGAETDDRTGQDHPKQQDDTLPEVLFVIPRAANVRSGPDVSSDPVCCLRSGRRLDVMGKQGNWYEIYWQNDDGTDSCQGWISAKVVDRAYP